ncbi:MAG: hypothetical protein OXB91_00685 [Bryobacterales bacterium]|nr:hypothetical protein [Bryobacterales bacterium]
MLPSDFPHQPTHRSMLGYLAISILWLLPVAGIKRRMDQLPLRPDSAFQLLLG